jgi:hypothetical protein
VTGIDTQGTTTHPKGFVGPKVPPPDAKPHGEGPGVNIDDL